MKITASDDAAPLLTAVLKTILSEIDDLACRVVQNTLEREAIEDQLWVSTLHAAKTLDDLAMSDVEANGLCKFQIKTALTCLRISIVDTPADEKVWEEMQAIIEDKAGYDKAVQESKNALEEFYKYERDKKSSEKVDKE